ncbi:phage tail assembly protein T [Achromobacter anxifer]|uniref:phage tail assembly protein T n=1 Tax=Achromobacter anxifer TaxID=1287737 RepID=UPI004032F061
MPVRELLQRLSSAEFTEYMAFANIEPFGSHIDDRRAGAVVSMLANINRDTKNHPKPFDDLFFLPWNDATRRADQQAANDLIMVDDPERMSELLTATLFGEVPTSGEGHGESDDGG